jgi:hypothetical protein
MPTDNIKIYADTVLRHTILQGQEAERTTPGTFAMGELAFTRDTGRVFVGTYTENRSETEQTFKEIPGGLIVGNKFHGKVDNIDEEIENIEYVARHIPQTNFYEGDTVFDTNAANLIIFNLDETGNKNNINIKSFNVSDSFGILQTTLNTDNNCFDISINDEQLQSFISTKLQEGFDYLSISSHCSLPKKITYDGTNISMELSKVEDDKEYITTIKKTGEEIEFSPTSYEDFFKMANVTVRPDDEYTGIKVRKSDAEDGKGTVYKIGLDPTQGFLIALDKAEKEILSINEYLGEIKIDIPLLEENYSNVTQKINTLQNNYEKRGLYYLDTLKIARYSDYTATITKDNFQTDVDDDTYKLINSVILQLNINTTTLPVDYISLETINGHVLQTHPKGSGNYITTIEIPYTINENDVKQFQLYCNQPEYATIKILGYRI